mmetsp:Transcript_16796/g.28072  ORF Transcript_16796/g.28072 Transcript_16796/m.28072 type:complete len:195 (-) Transcript_16796:403-987(-)|eukprot:CAMPEP_0114430590 /NCGR_PEP_ID=MMETSP0103-20121206/10122_1 /TAXON_ID=37642 ORGANISM="Paraphysomonas imperforata, Strain PA2" /NCGR_SAMPLE_ID=MMETSP0103 /ASSEMBLY_ACC=CAM_ASM_000201 /LENGTH=194 /DNA_ID=CAMNT_0001600047 /DNA_START=57 /DNA_END=641 /DNA_ORIENTATION=-
MFDPAKLDAQKSEKKIKKAATKQLKQWSMEIIPMDCSEGLMVDISEVVCGDPNCAPIDTVVSLVWESGGRGMWGIPAELQQIGKEDYLEYFPDEDTLRAWSRGEDCEWPKRPELRFQVDSRVECRIGPHPVRGWAPGVVVALWYREETWPQGQMAPYQVKLDDARLIFAPQDVDEVIRAEAPPLPPPSTEPPKV